MNSIFKTLFITLLIGILTTGCSKSVNSDAKQDGGVDGSGGDLPYFVSESFSDWVAKDHAPYVRDVIHRLFWLQKNSPADLKFLGELAPRFLGNSPEEFFKLLETVTYEASPNGCNISNQSGHSSHDASVSPSGKICFAYSAFKNLPIESAVSKLLSMTMHELSHLRGFNEADAVKLQLEFDKGSLGDRTILTFNSNYQEAREQFKKMSQSAVLAMSILLDAGKNSKYYACQRISNLTDRDVEFYIAASNFPSTLVKKVEESITMPMVVAEGKCLDASEYEIANSLAPVLKAFSDVSRMLKEYESPICSENFCSQRLMYTFSPDEELILWQAKKELFQKGLPYPQTDASSIECTLKDLTAGIEIELKRDQYGSIDFRNYPATDPLSELGTLLFLPNLLESPGATSIEITLSHNGSVQMLESENFFESPMDFIGVLQKGSVETSRLRFAIYKRFDVSTLTGIKPFYTFDPKFSAINVIPEKIKDFELNCKLNP